eukprot:jgi/Botrbrau1/8672/Bobra.0087s0025.1
MSPLASVLAWAFTVCTVSYPVMATIFPELGTTADYSSAATGLPIGLSVRQVTVPAGPAPGPALAPHGVSDTAESGRPAPIEYELLPSALSAQSTGQASISLSTGTLPTAGVTATASSTLGGTTTTAEITYCDCILVMCLRCEECLPPDKCSWPECVGMNVFDAQKVITKESTRTPVPVRKGSATTTDWRGDRVRLVYDPVTFTVISIPEVG